MKKSAGAQKRKRFPNGTLVKIRNSKSIFLRRLFKNYFNKIGIIVGTYDYPAIEYGYVVYVNGRIVDFVECDFEVIDV
mgnify:CR=1 FL=1